jgi:hypothetical protein
LDREWATPASESRSGSRNLHRGYEWNFCLNAA